MKKIITAILTVVLALSLMSVCVGAEGEAKNYISGTWDTGGLGAGKVTSNDAFSCVTEDVKQPWHSPAINIYPAVKAALGDEDEVEILFTFEAKVTWVSADYEGEELSIRPLLRGGKSGGEDYNEKLQEYCDENEVSDKMFSDSAGNVMCTKLGGAVTLTDGEWTLFESEPVLFEKGIVAAGTEFFNDAWRLCFDNMKVSTDDFSNIASIDIQKAGVYVAEEYYEANATPTPEPTPTPTATPEATPTPDATPTPTAGAKTTASAGANATAGADAEDGGSSNTGLIIGIIAAVVVVAVGAAVAVVVIKKKKG